MLEFNANGEHLRVECKAVVEASDVSDLAIVVVYEPESVSGEYPDSVYQVLVATHSPGWVVNVREALYDKEWRSVNNERMASTWREIEPMLDAMANDDADIRPFCEREILKDICERVVKEFLYS